MGECVEGEGSSRVPEPSGDYCNSPGGRGLHPGTYSRLEINTASHIFIVQHNCEFNDITVRTGVENTTGIQMQNRWGAGADCNYRKIDSEGSRTALGKHSGEPRSWKKFPPIP